MLRLKKIGMAKEKAEKEWKDDYGDMEGAPPFIFMDPEPEDMPYLK